MLIRKWRRKRRLFLSTVDVAVAHAPKGINAEDMGAEQDRMISQWVSNWGKGFDSYGWSVVHSSMGCRQCQDAECCDYNH